LLVEQAGVAFDADVVAGQPLRNETLDVVGGRVGHDGLISHADIVQILGRSIKARHGAPRLTPKRRKANDEVD